MMIADMEASKTSKFEWILNNIGLEILAPILPPSPNLFLEVSALLAVRHCSKQQSWAISSKTNDGTLRKKKKFNSKLENVIKRLILGPITASAPIFGLPIFVVSLSLKLIRHCSKL